MLEDFNAATDEAKRQLYVAMTRAKRNLTIHLNGNFLDNITAENLELIEDREERLPPKEMAMHLSFRDVWLDYFISRQHLVSQLTSGDTLTINSDECRNSKGQSVLKFSRQFLNTIETQKLKGFYLKQAKVKIILPELIFERQDN